MEEDNYIRVKNIKNATHFEWKTSACVGFSETGVVGTGFLIYDHFSYKGEIISSPVRFRGIYPINQLDKYKKEWGQVTLLKLKKGKLTQPTPEEER